MELYEAIFTRQSVGKVRPDPLPRLLIEKLLLAAAQAPNHYKVRPWRFVVLTGTARDRLGEVMAESFRAKFPALGEDALAKERAKPLRAPVVIAVGVDKPLSRKWMKWRTSARRRLPVRTSCWRRRPRGWGPSGAPAIRRETRRSSGFWALLSTST